MAFLDAPRPPHLLLKNKTAAALASENPVLGLGERRYETDTKKYKVGDGVTAWNSLGYGGDADAAANINDPASSTRTALNAAYAGLQSDRGREYLQTKRTIALREWFRSLGARNTAPANWMGIGDSISERKSCTKFRNAYQNIAQGILRTNIPTTGAAGGDGYVPAILSYATSALADWPYSYSGSGWVRDTTKGLGFVASNLSPGGVITLNVPAGHTAVDIFYGKTGGSPGTRALTVALDGGAGTVIDTVGSTLDFIPYRVTLPNSNAHTITVTGSGSSAAAIFDGAYLYNGDESKGIRAWVNGQSSLPAKTITANYLAILGNQVAQIQPSLFTIELGANDYQNGTPTTAATFKTNIQSITSTIRANCTRPPSIVLMVPWTWTPGVTPVEAGGWAAFVTALYEIAAADDDICIFDMQQRVTLATTSDATTKARGLLGSDSIHPSDEGAWMIGYALARFLTP